MYAYLEKGNRAISFLWEKLHKTSRTLLKYVSLPVLY